MKHNSRLVVFILFLSSTVSFGQPGLLDGDFDADGIVTTIVNGGGRGKSVVIQPDGKIIVAGYSKLSGETADFAVVRYNIDGSLDNTFSVNGLVTTDFGNDDFAHAISIQADGKIIVAGRATTPSGYKFAILRYNSDGTLDNSFNTNGKILGAFGTCNSLAIQSDGKIVFAGSMFTGTELEFGLTRYSSDGSLDNSFGTDGIVTTDVGVDNEVAYSVAIQPDGKIVVAGESFDQNSKLDIAVVRYNPDGSLDNSFSVNGIVTTAIGTGHDFGRSLVIQPDGKIVVVGGGVAVGIAVVRYNSDGTLDNSFNIDGKVITNLDGQNNEVAKDVVLQADGKIVVTGGNESVFNEFALLRYNTDGTLDTSFDADGIVITEIGNGSSPHSCAIQPNGRIVVAGVAFIGSGTGFAVARYISGSNLGVISFSKQDHGLLIYPIPIQENAMIEYTLTIDETISIDLYDITGRLVQPIIRSEKRDKGPHKETLVFDTSIPSGIYILTLSNGVGSTSVQIVK